MFRMLNDVAAGLGTHGTAYEPGEHGGRYATARALRRRGLLDGDELTETGRQALEAATKFVPIMTD